MTMFAEFNATEIDELDLKVQLSLKKPAFENPCVFCAGLSQTDEFKDSSHLPCRL